MIQYLAVVAMGPDQPGLAQQITDLICQHQGQIELASMNKMGTEFTMNLLISGNRNSIIKLEDALNELEEENEIQFLTKQIEEEPDENACIPYIAQIITAYSPTTVQQVCEFFAEQGINIREITAARYIAQQTGTEMLNLQLLVDVPVSTEITAFRQDFTAFCEEANIDASLEPDKL